MKQNPLPLADRLLADPDYAIRVFRELKQERAKRAHLERQTAEHRRWAATIRPKLDFLDRVLRRDELLPTAVIAADYGMTERDFADMLRVLGICSDTGYGLRLMPRYAQQGYTAVETVLYGNHHKDQRLLWTQRGRYFLYQMLKDRYNLLPRKENLP
jgi:phage antirepressor YoqD-like protein